MVNNTLFEVKQLLIDVIGNDMDNDIEGIIKDKNISVDKKITKRKKIFNLFFYFFMDVDPKNFLISISHHTLVKD